MLNQDANPSRTSALLPVYSQKAVYVKIVPSTDTWYVTTPDSVTESHVFLTEGVHIMGETLAALARIGAGKLGYVGDVNGEEGSNAVLLAMHGLRRDGLERGRGRSVLTEGI